jgi:hypothetical protein
MRDRGKKIGEQTWAENIFGSTESVVKQNSAG